MLVVKIILDPNISLRWQKQFHYVLEKLMFSHSVFLSSGYQFEMGIGWNPKLSATQNGIGCQNTV